MATSPLLQMPLLNAITTLGTDSVDSQNPPTPFNRFGSVTAGWRFPFQNAPMEIFFLAPNIYGTSGSHYACEPFYTVMGLNIVDFDNIFSADIAAQRTSPNLSDNNWLDSVFLIVEDLDGKVGDYGKVLPPIEPYYGEAGTRYSRFRELALKPEKISITPWFLGFAPHSYSGLTLLYSRFATDNIRSGVIMGNVEWPIGPGGSTDGASDYTVGFSESADLVPLAWGARLLSDAGGPYCAVWNLDTLFGYLYEREGIDTFVKLESFYQRRKRQGYGTVNYLNSPSRYPTKGILGNLQCANNPCYDWGLLVSRDAYFQHFSLIYPLQIPEGIYLDAFTGCRVSSPRASINFDGRVMIMLSYLFESNKCYRKNPQTGGDFYVNLPLMWETFRNQGVYCRNYYT